MRRCTPTWLAASPVPGASYMVSIIESTRLTTAPSMSSTSRVRSLSTGSPYWRMVRLDMRSILPALPLIPDPGRAGDAPIRRSERDRVDLDAEPAAGRPGGAGQQVTEGIVGVGAQEEPIVADRCHRHGGARRGERAVQLPAQRVGIAWGERTRHHGQRGEGGQAGGA